MNETNPYLIRKEKISEARMKWQESEWTLNLLRSLGKDQPKQLKDEEVLLWNKQD